MAEYFTARGMPVPLELRRTPLTDWRRWAAMAATLLVLYFGVQLLQIDVSRANPEYAGGVIGKLLQWDFSILTPQNEFETFWDTAEGLMIVTIFLGIVATALAMVVALPLAFLGARNIMTANPLTSAIYAVVRVIFTIVRSIDVLIVVIVFAVIFGLGSAAGVFGLAFHNIGALGKLYSEAIESIDPGPIEAITATGATRFQVVMFGVVPQIVPQFVAFTIYRWDINVRMATVIGLVGGGGIGFILKDYIDLLRWPQAGTAILLIAATVMIMDYASAVIRESLQ